MKKILTEIAVLILSYILVRYVFFNLYGSFDASWIALIPAIFGIAVSYILKSPITGYGTAIGYILAFAASQLFRHDYIDPNRGNARYSNYLEIWILTYVCIIAVCLIIDMLQKRKRRK